MAAKEAPPTVCNSLHKTEERRNNSLFTVMAFEQRCVYIFRRCLKLIRLIFSTWNKYDSLLMGKLYNLEDLAKAELKEAPFTRDDLAYLLKGHFENCHKYAFWVDEMARNKFVGRYLSLQTVEATVRQLVADRKQSRGARTDDLLWAALVRLNELACLEAVHRVRFSLSKTIDIIKVCKETHKPIINRVTKRTIREDTQHISTHLKVEPLEVAQVPAAAVCLKEMLRQLACKEPLREAQKDLAVKEQELEVYRLQLFSHRGKSTPTTARSRRQGKYELLRNFPSTRMGSHMVSARTSIANLEASETWLE